MRCGGVVYVQSDRFLDLLFSVKLTQERLDILLMHLQKTLNGRRKKDRGAPEGPRSRLLLRHLNSEVPVSRSTAAAAAQAATEAAEEAAAAAAGAAPKWNRQEQTGGGRACPKEGTVGGGPRLRRRSLTWAVVGPPPQT